MSNEELFEKNLKYFCRYFPEDAISIRAADTSKVETLQSHQEARQWFQEIKEIAGVEVLIIFGIGQGYYYNAAKKWLAESKKHALVFLEDDKAVIKKFLETDLATEMLTNPQIIVLTFDTTDDKLKNTLPPAFNLMTQIFSQARWKFTALKSYLQKRNPLTSTIEIILNQLFDGMATSYLEHSPDREDEVYTNFYINFGVLPRAYQGHKFKDKFKNIPAIICGAGSSLYKIKDQIAKLGDKALIFGAGTGMNTLNKFGIMPHFGGSLDPNIDSISRMMTNYAYDIPYFYSDRFHYLALKYVSGPRLYLRTESISSAQEWLEEEVGIKETVQVPAHVSTTNYLLHVAQFLGCNPIILAGVDLAYTDKSRYHKEVKAHPLDMPLMEESISKLPLESGNLIPLTNTKNERIFSRFDWLNEANSYTSFAKKFPDVTLLNVTEGGLPIHAVENPTLEEVTEKYLNKNYNLHQMINQAIHDAGKVPVTQENILETLEKWKKSFLNYITNENKEEPSYQFYLKNIEDMHKRITFRVMYAYEFFPEHFTEDEHKKKQIEFDQTLKQLLNLVANRHIKIIDRAIKECRGQIFSPENELKKSIIPYKNGLLDGTVILYHPNGTKWREINFSIGKLHGIERAWNPDGQLILEIEYQMNVPIGIACLWHDNGIHKMEKKFYDSPEHYDLRLWNSLGEQLYEKLYMPDLGPQLLEQSKDRRQAMDDLKKKLEDIKRNSPNKTD